MRHVRWMVTVLLVLVQTALLCVKNGFPADQGCTPAEPAAWLQLFPEGALPSGRHGFGEVYNPASNRMIIYGGYHYTGTADANTGPDRNPSDVWALTNANGREAKPPRWKKVAAGGVKGAPSQRVWAGTVYDEKNNILITYGGQLLNAYSGELTNEVWVLSHADATGGKARWKKLAVEGQLPLPQAFNVNQPAYDPATNRLIVFGSDGVWVLTNANGTGGPSCWLQLRTAATSPRVEGDIPVVSYDGRTNQLIVFLSQYGASSRHNEVWTLTNANGSGGESQWVLLCSETPFTPHPGATGIFDPVSNCLAVFGGFNRQVAVNEPGVNEVWVMNNANGCGGAPEWWLLRPEPDITGRNQPRAVYDQGNNRMMIFGGQATGGAPALNESWVLTGVFPR